MSSTVQVSWLGVGDDARDLDRDVGPPGDLGDVLAPRMLGAVLDRGHAAVIKNKLDGGRKVGERDRLVDLIRPHAEVERPRRSGKPLDVGAKRRAFAEIVRNDVQDAAKAFHERIGELTVEKGGKAIILRPARADRAPQEALGLARKVLDVSGFGLDVVGRDVDLHVKGVGDAATSRLDGVGFIGKVAIERRDAGEPRIAQTVAVDEVEMRVDYRRLHRALRRSEVSSLQK